jgi:nicotinate-nucleotide adenylyltransferase
VIRKKIGILGGTFDPVHFGHLQLAKAALVECFLDSVVFIPAAHPPHKVQSHITFFQHRLAMLKIICSQEKQLCWDDIELNLQEPSYTIDTLMELKKKYPNSCLYFIVGGDAFLDFPEWKSYKDIFKEVNVVIAQRKGYQGKLLSDFLHQLGFSRQSNRWKGDCGMRDVFCLHTVPDDYSSSTIREMFLKNEIPRQHLPEKVINYIQNHKLYGGCAINMGTLNFS